MAITILSSNLNVLGDNGRFETDRSSWGFPDPIGVLDVDVRYTRQSSHVFEGIFAAEIKCHSINADPAWTAGKQDHVISKFRAWTDKYYVISAYVKNDPENPLYPDNADVFIYVNDGTEALTVLEETKTTGLEAKADFVKIETKIRVNLSSNSSNSIVQYFTSAYVSVDDPDWMDTSILAGGSAYIDKFEIFEYEEVVSTCTVEIDQENSTIAHESGGGADGSITVATTGAIGTLEYSIDDVSWQLSNVFSGLSEGLKIIYVREQADPIECKVQESFYINNDDSGDFDFTLDIIDESTTGADNGVIEVSVAGTGGPFEYSIDNGVGYQSSNIFTGLAAGLYTIIVKDDSDNHLARNGFISAGQFSFDRIYHSKNPIKFTRNQSSNSAEDNYRIQTEVQVESALGVGDFTKLVSTEIQPDSEGKCVFNLRQAFKGFFNPTPPSLNQSNLIFLTDRSILARNVYGDLFGALTVIDPGSKATGLPYLVVLGGLEAIYFPDTDFFGQYLSTNKKFLSWMPSTRTMDEAQENYVNFFLYSASITEVKLNITAYYDDDTMESDEISSINAIYGQLVQVPIGPANSGVLAINPAKNLLNYTLHLTDQADEVISETLTITLSAFKSAKTRYLMYRNSLGTFEVLRTVGIGEEKAKVERQNAEKYLSNDYKALDGQLVNYSAISQRSHKISTGLVSKAVMKSLQDFQLSSQVYDITDGQRRPIVLKENSFIIHEDENHQKALRFEYLDAYKNEVYSDV